MNYDPEHRGLFRKCLSFFQAINGTLKHASLCPRAGLIDGLDLSPHNVNAVLEPSRIKIAENCRSHVAWK